MSNPLPFVRNFYDTNDTATVDAHVQGLVTGGSVFLTPLTVSSGTVTFGGLNSITQGDLFYASSSSTVATLAKDTNATRYLSNTGASNNPAWAQVDLATGVSGTLPSLNGGLGFASSLTGDLIFASAANTWSRLADVTTGNALISGGVLTAPSWGKIGLTTHVTGTLAGTTGGLGFGSALTGDLIFASSANTWSRLAAVATGNALISGGLTTAPSWGKIGLTTHVTGTLGVGNGGTGTATTFTQGSVIFAGASGIYSQNNTKFFWDNTNFRLGINVPAPQDPISLPGTLGRKLNIFDDAIASDFHGLLMGPGIMGFRVPTSGHSFVFYNFDSSTENEAFRIVASGDMTAQGSITTLAGLTTSGELDFNNIVGSSTPSDPVTIVTWLPIVADGNGYWIPLYQ